jgi:hypothetical protein
MSELVIVSMDDDTYFDELPSSLFEGFKAGVPAVGQRFFIVTDAKSEDSASRNYGPTIEITNVVHGTFRDIIPPDVSEVFTEIHDKEGYWVKAILLDTEISV